ncbi:MAG: hypothetical protein AAF184_19360 [Pseudomonadota bacterium]
MALFTGCVLQKSLIATTSATLSLSGLLLAAGGPAGTDGTGMESAAPEAPAILRFAECPREDMPAGVHYPAIEG